MSDVGGDPAGSPTVTLTLNDTGAAIPDNGPLATTTYKPTDFEPGNTETFTPLPVVVVAEMPQPNGTATFARFDSEDPNGVWKLYVKDDTGDDGGTIAGGWSIDITSAGGAAATFTTVTSSGTPSTFGGAVTFTATVTSSSTVNMGDVTFTDNGSNLTCTGGQPRPVNGSGVATCTTSTLAGGNRTITGTYNPGAGFLTSNGNTLQQVTTVSGTQFSNVGNIVIPSSSTSTPYPSQILVSGLVGNITSLTLTFTGLSHTDTPDIDVLLIGPNNNPLFLMSDTGDGTDVSGLNVTLSDNVANPLLPTGAALTSGTFRPANYPTVETFSNTTLGIIASDANNSAAPTGTKTFSSQFNGANPNGVWNLYIVDDTGGDLGSISGGWRLNITSAVPTAAGVSVSGRVLTDDGRGLRNAYVVLTDMQGNSRRAITSSFGYYRFEDVRAGETYVMSVSSKRYQFVSQVLSVMDELTGVDFTAEPGAWKTSMR